MRKKQVKETDSKVTQATELVDKDVKAIINDSYKYIPYVQSREKH